MKTNKKGLFDVWLTEHPITAKERKLIRKDTKQYLVKLFNDEI